MDQCVADCSCIIIPWERAWELIDGPNQLQSKFINVLLLWMGDITGAREGQPVLFPPGEQGENDAEEAQAIIQYACDFNSKRIEITIMT